MKTRSVIITLLLLALILSACSFNFSKDSRIITPSKTLVSENRPVSGFTGISLDTFGKLVITQGEPESLTIKGSDNVVPLIKTVVEDGVLQIKSDANFNLIGVNAGNVLTFTITVRDLQRLDVSGAGDVALDKLSTSKLTVDMSGAGQVVIKNLTADSVDAAISGAGNIDLGGETKSAKVEISGVGSFKGASLKTQTAEISLSGVGGAELWVTDQLTGEISGAGSVSYYGSPRLDTKTSGIGSFKSLGNK